MQASKKSSFLCRSPWAYAVVPLAFVLVSTALVFIVGHTMLAPYQALLGWFFSTTEVAQPRDLLDNAATVINGGTVDEPDAQPDRLPLSSVTYPSEGDRYATITISGTNVDAPVVSEYLLESEDALAYLSGIAPRSTTATRAKS